MHMQALLREFQRGEEFSVHKSSIRQPSQGVVSRKKCCLGFQDVYVAGPSSPDGRPCSVLAKKSQKLCGLCCREAVVCNWETSHWPMGGNVTTALPHAFRCLRQCLSSHTMGVGVVHRDRYACLLCKKGLLLGTEFFLAERRQKASYFSPRLNF